MLLFLHCGAELCKITGGLKMCLACWDIYWAYAYMPFCVDTKI